MTIFSQIQDLKKKQKPLFNPAEAREKKKMAQSHPLITL
jgi:hypothetical protein